MSTGNLQDNPTAGDQMHSLWEEITELRDKLKVWQQIAGSAEHRAMVAADEIERLREALSPLAEIDLTEPPPNDFAWFVLRARAVLSGESNAQG